MCKTNIIIRILIVIALAGLPASVQANPDSHREEMPVSTAASKGGIGVPGFEAVVVIIGLLAAYMRRE